MGKRKKVASVMFTDAVATAMTGVGVQPASASPSHWTNTPGGPTTAENITPMILTWDTDLGPASLVCPATTVDATADPVTSATGTPTPTSPVNLGSISTTQFGTPTSPCSFLGFGLVGTLDNPIGISAVDFPEEVDDSTSVVTTTDVTLRGNINATITGVGTFDCDMHVTGSSVPGSYVHTEKATSAETGTLKVNPDVERTLHIDTVDGCSIFGLPLFTVGDAFGFEADFDVDPKQVITHS